MPLFSFASGGGINELVLKAKNKIDGVSKNNNNIIKKLISDIKNGKYVYLFFYWKDCGHCKNAYNDWEQFEKSVIGHEYAMPNINVYAIEQQGASELPTDLLKAIGGEPNGFPTFRYVKKSRLDGTHVSDYDGERDHTSLMQWMGKTSRHQLSGGRGTRRKGRKHNKSTNKKQRGSGFFDLFVGVDRIRGQKYEKWLEQRLISVHNDEEFVNKVRQLFGYDKTNITGRGQLTKQMVDKELCERSEEDRNLIAPDLTCNQKKHDNDNNDEQSGGRKSRRTRKNHKK